MTTFPKVPLGSLVKIVRGISYKSSELADGDRGVPMVNLRNVGKGGGFREDGLKRYTGEYKPSQVLEPGDLVLANTDLSKAKDVLGSTFLIPPTVSGAVLSLDLSKLIPDETVIDKKFLNYFLHSPDARSFMKANGQGITVMHLRMSALPSLEVPVPPIDDQNRIVEVLDNHLYRLDKALAETRNAQRKTEAFIKSYLLSLVEGKSKGGNGDEYWGKRQVGSLGKWRGGGTPSKSNPQFWVDGTIPWLTAKDMKTFRIKDTQDHITALGVSGSSANLLPSNAVVIVTRSGILEWKLPVAVTEVPVTVNQDLKALVCHPDVLPDWAAYSILGFEHRVLDECRKAGTTVANLNVDDFLKFEILVPPLEVQRTLVAEIISSLDYLNSIRARVDEIEKTTQSMRRSLLKSAFSGELLKVR